MIEIIHPHATYDGNYLGNFVHFKFFLHLPFLEEGGGVSFFLFLLLLFKHSTVQVAGGFSSLTNGYHTKRCFVPT